MTDVDTSKLSGLNPNWLAFWNLVIRPPRAVYDVDQLGPPEFYIQGVRASRRDVRLQSPQGHAIECSHFIPRPKPGEEKAPRPVVIYLHGNSGNRLEVGTLLEPLLRRGLSLFCYDSIGCGLSGGEYVSLGWHEKEVLATVVAYLRGRGCGKVGIWGRSMGAATALLHVDRDPGLGAVVLDSPFASLPQLIGELAEQPDPTVAFRVPAFVVGAAMSVLRGRVQTLAEFDIDDVVPLNHAAKSKVPAFFVHGMNDAFITQSHSYALFDAYGGQKEYMTISADHNGRRSITVLNACADFLGRVLRGKGLEDLPSVADENGSRTVSAVRLCFASGGGENRDENTDVRESPDLREDPARRPMKSGGPVLKPKADETYFGREFTSADDMCFGNARELTHDSLVVCVSPSFLDDMMSPMPRSHRPAPRRKAVASPEAVLASVWAGEASVSPAACVSPAFDDFGVSPSPLRRPSSTVLRGASLQISKCRLATWEEPAEAVEPVKLASERHGRPAAYGGA